MTAAERVIVVGAGVAGLVVARDLALAGVPVTVLEAGERIGGQLDPVTVAGVEVDAAAESFATRDGAVAELLLELGLRAAIVPPLESPAWLVRGAGDAMPLPAAAVLGIPAEPFASDVVAAIGWQGALRAQLDSVIPLVRPAKYTTIGDLVRRRMGRRVLDRLVAPVVRGVYSTTPDALAIDVAQPTLRAVLARTGTLATAVAELRAAAPAGSQVNGLVGGVHRLAAELAARAVAMGVDLRLGVRVVAVDSGGVTTDSGERLGGRVVVAAPGVASAPLVQREITVVVAAVDAPGLDAAPRGTGALIEPDAPGIVARAFTHASAKWAWLGEALPPHRHLVRLSYDLRPTDLEATVASDLRAITGVAIDRLVEVAAITWTRTLESGTVPEGVLAVGEAASQTGLARIVPGARAVAAGLIGSTDPESGE